MTRNILLTGASGFVGKQVLSVLKQHNHSVSVLGRSKPVQADKFFQANLNSRTDYSKSLESIEVLIHVAARAHVMNEQLDDPLTEYREVNNYATLNLARQAAVAGVKRFIFISSIKVNGEDSDSGRAFTHRDKHAPQDAYGVSKAEAEQALWQLATETAMEVVVIRPPLVYGPGVKANFASMLNVAQKNLPLPLGAIDNRRSLVALDNLVDLIVTCIDHPNAANQTFLVSDDQDVSTTELLQMMTRAAGKTPRLLPVPVSWLKLVGRLTGRSAVIDRLCGNLQLDISHTKDTLGWKPPITLEEGIARCFAAKGRGFGVE